MAGKGDRYRKVDSKKFGESYDRIFGKKEEPDFENMSVYEQIKCGLENGTQEEQQDDD